MIAYIKGTIIEKHSDSIILETAGIGYKVKTSRVKNDTGDTIELYIHHHTGSDNQQNLFGVATSEELQLLQKLIKVSGVGPTLALKVIESDSLTNLENSILEGDITFFTRVKGLGKKNAQKIILELKDKLVDVPIISKETELIFDALSSLGFTRNEITKVLTKIDISNLPPGEAIQQLLKELGN